MAENRSLIEKPVNRVGSICYPDVHEGLYEAFASRNLNKFQEIIDSDSPDLDHWYGDPHHGTLLDLACAAKEPAFVQCLIKNNADPNLVNKLRKQAPLHIVAENNDIDSARELLSNQTIKVNVKDVFGNTALHLAVKWIEPNGLLDLLLKNPDLNVNICNRKNKTPLHLAMKNENKIAVEKLISRHDIQVNVGDNLYNDIIEKYPDLEDRINHSKNNEITYKPDTLFGSLRSNPEAFMKSISVALKESDGILDEDDGCHTFLQYACEHGFSEVVDCLLNLGANPNKVTKMKPSPPILIAGRKGNEAIVKRLLRDKATLFHPVPELGNQTVLHSTILGIHETPGLAEREFVKNHKGCLKAIIDEVVPQKLNINASDVKGNTALHYAGKLGDHEIIMLLLKAGAYIGSCNKFGEVACSNIKPNIFEEFLDSCVDEHNNQGKNEYEIVMKYNFIVPTFLSDCMDNLEGGTLSMEGSDLLNPICYETKPLLQISQIQHLRSLLKHPIFTSFLYLKWHKVRWFFYVNLLIYLIFWVSLTFYILCIHIAKGDERDPGLENFLWGFCSLFLLLIFFRELFQFLISPTKYVSSPENWLEISIIVISVIILFCRSCDQIKHQMSSFAILLSWTELVLLLGRHPLLSTNIEMLKTVSSNFLKFLAWYSILILAFALSFYSLFRDVQVDEDNFFEDPGTSVFKTIVMLTGEFEAASIPFVQHPGTSHVLFVLFIFLIAIVLFNLLNGLAVSDTHAIKMDAELVGYISRVKYISYIENMFSNPTASLKFYSRFKNLFCCFPQSPESALEYTQQKSFFFLRRINLFDKVMNNFVIKIYPNQGHLITLDEFFHQKESRNSSNSLRMDPSITHSASNVLDKKITMNANLQSNLTVCQKLDSLEKMVAGLQLSINKLNENLVQQM